MSPLASALVALVIGLAAGSLATWWLLRRAPAPAAAEPDPVRAAPPRPGASPEPGHTQAELPLANDDLKPVIDASRSLLEDLERRYPTGGPSSGREGKPARPRGGQRGGQRGGGRKKPS